MSDVNPWQEIEEKAGKLSDFEERQAKIERISRDPRPEYAAPIKKDYPTTEQHYIVCFDADQANLSMPESSRDYGIPHAVGNFLISDRIIELDGWMKTPPKGTSIDSVKESHPSLHEALTNKKVTNF